MPRWGMVIDLDKCTGCQACVVACRAENNVPVAGAEATEKRRDINWITVHRIESGTFPEVKVHFMPVPCQQCQDAPCETVCPTHAANHSERDGLNQQVYARCIGMRYCANACPYTVRMFNWSGPSWPESLQAQLNPDVHVRQNGVMEKCTFCIQRIHRARAEFGEDVPDGAVQPACVQSCPAHAMVFGDLKKRASRVAKLARNDRAFKLLDDLGTDPSVVYLRPGAWSSDGS